MVNSNNVTRKFTMKEKLASLGPGFVIVGSFIGPGTVTSCTLAGATYGFTLFWCGVLSFPLSQLSSCRGWRQGSVSSLRKVSQKT